MKFYPFVQEKRSITEAVKITIPGVMEMQLAPADIDVDATKGQIATQEQIVNEVLSKYKVEDLDKLEELAKSVDDKKGKITDKESALKAILGDITYEELEAEAKTITDDIRSKEAVENDIVELCEKNDIENFITRKKTIIEGYEENYVSIDGLRKEIKELEIAREEADKYVSEKKDIPDKCLNISNPAEHLEKLKADSEKAQGTLREAFKKKTEATRDLEKCKKDLSVDLGECHEKTKRGVEEQEEVLKHWKHIEEVFRSLKEDINDNPMQDVADSFTHYLNVISDGKISSEFPEADRLDMNIYSDNRLLDYGKLSEGTKETVSVAFRLAVLDHLFPDGGGIIVFDDSFANMDAERAAQSCQLIKECAKRHQVIFLTCREEYLEMLNGNEILF